MFNWVSGPWLVCIVAVLIATAFFWPDKKNTPDKRFETLNTNQETVNTQNSSDQQNSFSRDDDRARLLQFKELDAFDRNIEALHLSLIHI